MVLHLVRSSFILIFNMKAMSKKLIELILKGIFLTILFLVLLISMEPLFTEDEASIWEEFYHQKKDNIDLLVLGNSHANTGLDLDILEAKLNINSINLSTRGQNIYQTYYVAKEAYRRQSPKVLILENFLFYERLTKSEFKDQDPSTNDYMKRYLSFEGKKLNEVKIEEAKEFYEGNLFENLSPVFKKHDRWNNLEKIKNRLRTKNDPNRNRGITVLSEASAIDYRNKTNFGLNKIDVLSDEKIDLTRIIELAKNNGTEKVVLLTLPLYKDYIDKIDYESFDIQLNAIKNQHKGFVDYIDLNKVYPNWDRTYFSNDPVGYNQHLNYKGAIIASNYLSNYLVDKFNDRKKIKANVKTPEYLLYQNLIKDKMDNGKRILGNLERINGTKQTKVIVEKDKFKGFSFEGWAAIEDMKALGNEIFIGLVQNKDFVYISSSAQQKNKLRKDVSKFFKKEDLYDNSGFQIGINGLLLEKGEYIIYLIIKNTDGKVGVKRTGKRVVIS